MPPRRRSTPTKSTPPPPSAAGAREPSASKNAAAAPVREVSFVPDPAHLIAGLTGTLPASSAPQPDYAFRILRPDDLVVLEIACFGLTLNKQSGAPPFLAPTRDGAYLVVGYTFQHVGEQAFYETESLATSETPGTPVEVLVAEPSRLVFDVPITERIIYSSAGVLEALSRLSLRVAPLATGQPEYALPPVSTTPLVTLAGGLVLARGAQGLSLARLPGRHPAAANTAAALIAQSSAMKMARTILATESAVDHTVVRNGVAASAPITTTGGISLRKPIVVRPRPRPRHAQPRRPLPDETAIEAPWRLILSPSVLEGFAHASTPQAAVDDPDHIELWHSRLGVRSIDPDDNTVTIDERDDAQRIVRAIWDRDQDGAQPVASDATTPFRTSLTGQWRRNLVTESADPTLTVPQPVNAQRLYLSSLGAWLDLHGKWVTRPYEGKIPESIESWDHIAPMGRDQFVNVSNPGYLFPFGHRASKITVTERRIDASGSPTAYLYQYTYILVREPVKTYDDNEMPLTRVQFKTLITPKLDLPVAPFNADLFFPTVVNVPYEFGLSCLDKAGNPVVLHAPLLWVDASYHDLANIQNAYSIDGQNGIPADGQTVALAKSATPGDTAFETHTLFFSGHPTPPPGATSFPSLASANIVVPAMKHLAPAAPAVDVTFAQPYVNDGFTGPNSAPQVFLELVTPSQISFAKSVSGGTTEKSGGFLQPDIPVRGLSRVLGTVGDIPSLVNSPSAGEAFDPMQFLLGALPKLFGLFALTDIIGSSELAKAPKFVTQTLNAIASMLADLESLEQVLTDGLPQLADSAANAATAPLRQAASGAQAALAPIQTSVTAASTQLTAAISALTGGDTATFAAQASLALGSLGTAVTGLSAAIPTLGLPPVLKAQLQRLVGTIGPLVKDAATLAETITQITDFVKGLDPSNLAIKASFEWQPVMHNWPATGDPLFHIDQNGLLLSVEARASGTGAVGVDVLAQLSNFGLNLFPGATLIDIKIDRLSFRSSNGSKPEVDVVMNTMAWQGFLSFIATLEELIPMDGFSDPPYVDVDASGIKAGFDLALPSISVGVFALENMSLGADVSIPFLGDAVTVGFYFCTRDKPFRLTVMCVGGGGFVGIRLSPKGLVLLEMALEACAELSIDLGVASGSVSIAVGIYLKLEASAGSLTGYFRIRGEVDVLGIISASITLELSLTYDFGSGKMIGRASVSVEVSVFMFSFSVSISCERKLAGANSDPTFGQLLGIADDGTVPDPGAPDGGVPAWSDYCAAFAGA
jgi:hypothetical protein